MDVEKRERWRRLTVDLAMAVRSEYLASGASALSHWDQIKDRMLAAARTTQGASEWVTALCRRLSLAAPGKPLSGATEALVSDVESGGPRGELEFLAFVEAEYGLILARARLEGERRRAETLKKREEKETAAGKEMGFLPLDEFEEEKVP